MRPLIHYSDLGAPPVTAPPPPYAHTARRPPSKKRKRHYQTHKTPSAAPALGARQHWDDPGSAADGVVYDEQEAVTTAAAGSIAVYMDVEEEMEEGEEEEEEVVVDEWRDGWEEVGEEMGGGEEEEEEEGEESRPLTQEEIWDDAALVDAWNAAEAEYEAYHGTSKSWKTEPVKKSPLWYNKPYTAPLSQPQPGPSKPKLPPVPSTHDGADAEPEPEPDSAPLDFDTYVPTHDPSLGIPSTADANAGAAKHDPWTSFPLFSPPASLTSVSRDEAFQNALSATYWSGYWTAVCHCQSQSSGKSDHVTPEEDGIEADENEGESEEDLVPTQR